jgi:hypothetical protein
MTMHTLDKAKKSLEKIGASANLDPDTTKHLTAIADALGEAEARIDALERVVTELCVHAKLKNSPRLRVTQDYHVQKLLGEFRG